MIDLQVFLAISIMSKFNKNLSICFLVVACIYFDFLYFYVVYV